MDPSNNFKLPIINNQDGVEDTLDDQSLVTNTNMTTNKPQNFIDDNVLPDNKLNNSENLNEGFSNNSQQVPSLVTPDLIEKEWVDKAKKIVQDSSDDPREESNRISRLKADYLSKTYNKQLRQSE